MLLELGKYAKIILHYDKYCFPKSYVEIRLQETIK